MNKSTVVPQEIAKFAQLADDWWDKDGVLKTLHDINPARLEFISQYVDLNETRILDVGCGGGILCEAMAANGARVVGIDAEPEALQCAKAHAQTNQLAIDYHYSPIETYEADAFAAITCMEMLEHVDEPQLVIEHCARLLQPGGFLFLSTINRTIKAYFAAIIAAEYILNLLPKQTHHYDKFIQPGELAAMVRKAGLDVIGLRGIAYNPLSRKASLQSSVAVNYLLACCKPTRS